MITTILVIAAIAPIILAVGGAVWMWLYSPIPYAPSTVKPDDWGAYIEDNLWEEEAKQLRLGGLTRIRTTAEKWAQAIAALVAVFASVFFLKGPESLSDLSRPEGSVVASLLILAAVEVLIATLLAVAAAQGTPRATSQLDGYVLKQWSRTQVGRARQLLRWSRFLGVAGAATILLAGIFSSVAHLQETGPSEELFVVIGPGGVSCGSLKRDPFAPSSLSVGDLPLVSGVRITRVESCPSVEPP